MLIKAMILSLFILSSSTYARGDFGAGNGGDTVECSSNAEFQGEYFLDYLVARMENPKEYYIDSFDRLIEKLEKKIPELALKVKELKEDYDHPDMKKANIWKNITPREIADENLLVYLPDGCDLEPTQLVIRRKVNKSTTYFFTDRSRMDAFKPQYSWIFLHEVLWSIYDNAFEIRVVNEFIHNLDNYDLSSMEFIQEINRLVSPKIYGNYNLYHHYNEYKDNIMRVSDEIGATEAVFSDPRLKEKISKENKRKLFAACEDLFYLVNQNNDNVGKSYISHIDQLKPFNRRAPIICRHF
ncbi:MAG: hypothetical protein CME66_10735 [Halobacteriovoraceae bacterium]|nr:hypothetical protein [Halobacteriovoraceae bacterium]